MRISLVVVGVFIALTLSGCGREAPPPSSTKSNEPSASASHTNGLGLDDTYVRAPGDPKTHVLRVKIVDNEGTEFYEFTRHGCVSNALSQLPNQLVIIGPNAEYESDVLKTVDIPLKAESNQGACEAEMMITVPYAPRYSMAIPQEGQGIATPYDYLDTPWIVTKGSTQKVTLVSQMVTNLKSD